MGVEDNSEDLANEVTRIQERLKQAGLVATRIDVSADGEVSIPTGSVRFAAKPERRLKLDNTLVPAVAVLLGALIGAVMSLVGVLIQAHDNQRQALDEFMRTQRQVAYAGFLSDANELRYDQLYYIKHQKPGSLQEKVKSLITKVADDFHLVYLLGPPNVSMESYRVYYDASALEAAEHLGNAPTPSGRSAKEFLQDFITDYSVLESYMGQVISGNEVSLDPLSFSLRLSRFLRPPCSPRAAAVFKRMAGQLALD
jgi:hypothetical protein